MKISKNLIATLVALGVAGMGVIGHAAPPVGKTVLQTYSCNRVNNCYTGVGTGKTGWIAAHDDLIRLYEIRSDGWVRGDYPAGSGRVTRWFKFGDLVMNGNFQNYEANLVNVKTAPVYRTHNSGSSFGTVYNTDKVIVVDEYGSRKCIVYNLDAGGYKMGWVDGNKVARVSRVPTNVTNNLITPIQRTNTKITNLKGDVNNDGKVTEADLTDLKKYLMGTRKSGFNTNNADVNGDGRITTTDASKLKSMLTSGTTQVQKVKSVDVTETKAYWDSKKYQQVANLGRTECYRSPNGPGFSKSYTSKKDGSYHPTNCTWYAWGRMKEVTGAELLFNNNSGPDAIDWANKVNKNYFRTDGSIESKCVAVRTVRGGHVAFVEYFDKATNTVYFTECNASPRPDYVVQVASLADFEGSKSFWYYIHRK